MQNLKYDDKGNRITKPHSFFKNDWQIYNVVAGFLENSSTFASEIVCIILNAIIK